MSKVGIIILAAGTSSRMGEAKQLLPYKKTTLLGWAVEQAQKSNANEIICVLGANADQIKKSIQKYKVTTIFNSNFKEGLSSSIVAGVQEFQNLDALLFMLADQPGINAEYLNKFLESFVINPTKIIASNYGKTVGVPAVFPKKYYKILLKLSGDQGAKKLLNTLTDEIISLEAKDYIHDIDSPDDYSKLIH